MKNKNKIRLNSNVHANPITFIRWRNSAWDQEFRIGSNQIFLTFRNSSSFGPYFYQHHKDWTVWLKILVHILVAFIFLVSHLRWWEDDQVEGRLNHSIVITLNQQWPTYEFIFFKSNTVLFPQCMIGNSKLKLRWVVKVLKYPQANALDDLLLHLCIGYELHKQA